MGCGEPTTEERMLLTKLERLEIQVKKEQELKKLSELEGKNITNLNQAKDLEEDKKSETKIINKKITKSPKKEEKEPKDNSIKIFKSKKKIIKKKGLSSETEVKTKKKVNIIKSKNKANNNDSKPKLKKKVASEGSKKGKKK